MKIPVIAFGKGCWFALDQMSTSGAAALGVDWTCSPKTARALTKIKSPFKVILIHRDCYHHQKP